MYENFKFRKQEDLYNEEPSSLPTYPVVCMLVLRHPWKIDGPGRTRRWDR